MAETLQHHQNTQYFGLSPARPGNYRPDRPKSSNALTFKLHKLTGTGKFLAHTEKLESGCGYAVFGRIEPGMEVVENIAAVKPSNIGCHSNVSL